MRLTRAALIRVAGAERQSEGPVAGQVNGGGWVGGARGLYSARAPQAIKDWFLLEQAGVLTVEPESVGSKKKTL